MLWWCNAYLITGLVFVLDFFFFFVQKTVLKSHSLKVACLLATLFPTVTKWVGLLRHEEADNEAEETQYRAENLNNQNLDKSIL